MAKIEKRKAATVAGVGALAAALLLGGTFAWQSISQMALNENRASVNPGARLHDDYSGNYAKNTAKAVSDVGVKRVYVENFTDEQDKVSVIARVRLDEYMEIGGSAGYKKLTKTANGNYIKAGDDNGVIELVEEDTTTMSGKVIIKVKPIPYTGYMVDQVTVNNNPATTLTAASDGTYSYEAAQGTSVIITASFTSGTTTGDTIKKAKTLVEKANDGMTSATIDDVKTWKTYIPKVDADGNLIENSDSLFRNYVTLNFGWDSKYDTAGIYYMPTFNKNKDSLSADINGTYAKGFTDYVTYTANQQITDDAVYDADSNNIDDANVTSEEETHEAKAIDKTKSKVISMQKWLENPTTGDFWIYDTDGWAYWANLIAPEDATGLFLSRNEMTGKPEDNWYYGMNVVGQFVTSEDIGSDSKAIGFYTNANEKPSNDAKTLLGIVAKSNDAKTTSLESGKTIDVTYLKGEAQPLSLNSLETQEGKWNVSDDTVLTLSESEDHKVLATAHKPGEAVITYIAENGDVALTRVKVTLATYVIKEGEVSEAEAKGIVTYTDGEAKIQLKIAGTYIDKTNECYYQVTIGDNAFKNRKDITSLTLEDGISVIGGYAFAYCSSLEGTLEIPGSVKSIGGMAFLSTGIENVIICEGVHLIQSGAFVGAANLKKIVLPSSITAIGSAAFYGSPIENISFSAGNSKYCVEDLVLYEYEGTPTNKKVLLYYAGGKKDLDFTIPNSVVSIQESSFRANPYIQKVVISDSVTSIGLAAFMDCKALNEVVISKSVSDIRQGVFGNTPALTNLTVAGDNACFKAIEGLLYDQEEKKLVACAGGKTGEVDIPEGISEIYNYTFMNAANITEIHLPKSMETIPSAAFSGNTALTKIVYGGTKAEWNAASFSGLLAFKNLTIECTDGDIEPVT